LKPSYDEDDVQTRINGLAMLAPTSISLDQPDLPAFVTNSVMLAALGENWLHFADSFQRITLSELRPALENAARQLMSKPIPPPSNEFEREMQDLEFNSFLLAAGKRDPLAKLNAIDEYRRKEEEAYAAQKDAAYERMWYSGE
jgi:hypothetical protein